uniref:Uncharacterized protein n=1 Tax=uncultured bacterium 253 TaxID=698385 RepID=E3T731_9BACT|nr:hypothetical protein [uncultured bacterium 253]
MDMKENFSHRLHLRKRKKGDTAQLAAKLAPLEEQNKRASDHQMRTHSLTEGGANQEVGAIVIENRPGALGKDITDESDVQTFLGMEPVVLVILAGMIIFIIFVTWQISQMPVE